MRRIVPGLVALISVGLTALFPIPASAAGTAVLTAAGTDVPVGAIITGDLAPGTQEVFRGGGGAVRCGVSSFTATVTSNPAAGGVAAASITSWTHGGCTVAMLTGITGVSSVTTVGLPYGASFNGATRVVTISGPVGFQFALTSIVGPVTCAYSASTLNGTVSNVDNSLTLSGTLSRTAGSGLCPGSEAYSATFILRTSGVVVVIG